MNKSSTEQEQTFPADNELTRIVFDKRDVSNMVEHIVRLFHLKVTMSFNGDTMVYDMNTGTKSELHLEHTLETSEIKWTGRYDKEFEIHTAYDLLATVRDCMYGRPFIDPQWLRLLERYGMITVRRKTIEEIIF